MSFQKKATRVAGIILLIALIFIGWSIYNDAWNVDWPTDATPCPDYWKLTHNGPDVFPGAGEATCTDPQGTNSPPAGAGPGCEATINIATNAPWESEVGDEKCKKYKWAKGCGIKWDGYTNNLLACETKNDSLVGRLNHDF